MLDDVNRPFMCGDKIRFRSQKSALNKLRAIRKSGFIVDRDAGAYQCPFCNRWHLGHKPNPITLKQLRVNGDA